MIDVIDFIIESKKQGESYIDPPQDGNAYLRKNGAWVEAKVAILTSPNGQQMMSISDEGILMAVEL